jgi:hypothetical protein
VSLVGGAWREEGVIRPGPETPAYNTRVIPSRPDYKRHRLWEEAIRLTREAYGLAEQLRTDDPQGALALRKAAVAIPAHVAGALSAEQAAEREAEASGARAALAAVAARAEGMAWSAASSDLSRRARELERSVTLELASCDGGFVC